MNRADRLLIVAPFPYAAGSGQGGATVCSKALRLLQNDFEVGMVCFATTSPVDQKACQELQTTLPYFQAVPLRINKLKVLKAKLCSFLLRPEHTHYFQSREMRQALQQAIEHFKPGKVIFQFPQMAQYLPAGPSPFQTFMDVQDAYSVSWFRRTTATEGLAARIYALIQWLGWVRYERKFYPRAGQVWTLSKQDKFGLSLYSPHLSPLVTGLPLDIPASPQDVQRGSADHTFKVGFMGSFGHAPNVEALDFLCRGIAPLSQTLQPATAFVVAGRNPPPAITASAPSNVRFLGFVESLADFYGQCDVVIAPLLSGGGVKIKVAEALAHGKAVVTTAIGAEGLDVENGRHLLLADSAKAFVHQLEKLRTDNALRQRLQTEAYASARSQFEGASWLARIKDAFATH